VDHTGYLLVGTFPVASAEAVEDELLAVFRDDMLQVSPVPAEQYEQYMSVTGPEIESAVFRAPPWPGDRRPPRCHGHRRSQGAAFPDADVTIDVTWLGEYGWRESEPAALASNAQAAVRDKTTVHAPVIVLTEGTTEGLGRVPAATTEPGQ
jgi:hypothetical protein